MADDEVSELARQIENLVKSAASARAVSDSAPVLVALANAAQSAELTDAAGALITDGRALLLAGIAWLAGLTGRTADEGARNNYPYAHFSTAAEILFGAGAENYGTERRWSQVAKIFGAEPNATTGKRFAPRIATHLAAVIVSTVRTKPPARFVHTVDTSAGPGTRILGERTRSLSELLTFVNRTGLLRNPAWYVSIATAVHDYATAVDDRVLLTALHQTEGWDLGERLAIDSMLVSTSGMPVPIAGLVRTRTADTLGSPDASRRIPASMTFVRERAAIALTRSGAERPGVGLADGRAPDHIFLLIGRRTLLAKYPVTRSQYLSLCAEPAGGSTPDGPGCLPITNVTMREAARYCDQYGQLATECGVRFEQDGATSLSAASAVGAVRLASRADLRAVLPVGTYPWSGLIDDALAVARRMSYQRLVPVGLFPDEVRPNGPADICGLIWHWLIDPWDSKDATNRLRAVHGGGYGKNLNFLKCGAYFGADSASRRLDRGFRIAVDLKSDL